MTEQHAQTGLHCQPHCINPTIGVFDSGFGGLTVLRALLPLIPGAHFLYLGDTARLPYGSKSHATIARYAIESARFLEDQGCDYLIIACNTATALAFDDIRAAVSIPILGVIEPGAKAAFASVSTTTSLQVLVLATTATVHSHAYRQACEALGLHTTELPCPLLVPLVEEGWTDHPVTRAVLRIYLAEALTLCQPDVVLLGCTHYPLIAAQIELILRELGSNALVIDSAEATAAATKEAVSTPTTEAQPNEPGILSSATDPLLPLKTPATFKCFATDSIEKFARLGSHFLGQTIPHVELLDLGG